VSFERLFVADFCGATKLKFRVIFLAFCALFLREFLSDFGGVFFRLNLMFLYVCLGAFQVVLLRSFLGPFLRVILMIFGACFY